MDGPAGDGPIPDTEFIDDNDPPPHSLPTNQDPEILGYGIRYIQTYGWFILAGAILLWWLSHKFKSWLTKNAQVREQQAHKKYDTVTNQQKKMEAQEAVRMRMQAEHDAKAAEYAKQKQLRDEAKREERIKDWDRHMEGRGYRSKQKPQTEGNSSSQPSTAAGSRKKERLRTSDYNPLMGDTSSSNHERRFRPSTGGG